MYKTNLPRLILCAVLLLFPWTGRAGETPEARYFDIELVLFRYPNQYDGGEVWEPAPVASFSFTDTLPATPVEDMPAAEPEWWPLPDTSRTLGPVAYTLSRKAGYPVLAHVKWRQVVRAPGEAVPLALARVMGEESETLPAGLEGDVKVSVSRYLHLETDLRLVEGEVYALQQQRRMRSGELHYLDHPHLGLLALITPYEPPEAEPAADAVPEAGVVESGGEAVPAP